jgi:hypothetical protein
MTDGPRRSSMCVAEEQAALDLKKPGHANPPTGADGSSPSAAPRSRGATRWTARFQGTSADPDHEHLSSALMADRARRNGANGLVTCRRAQRSGAGLNEREEYA